MLIIIVYLVISFLLDGFMSNVFVSSLNSISNFITIYSVVALAIVYPYFLDKKKYYIFAGIIGIMFDAIYTSSLILNMTIFILLAFIINIINKIYPINLITTVVITSIIISIYHLINYIVLEVVGCIDYNFIILLEVISKSIVMTVLYTVISYLVIKHLFNSSKIKYIN